jgi:hypothetical protein
MSAAPSVARASREVFLVFDGPWAFAPDPKDANSVIAIAPKTKGHRDLFVQSHDKMLAAGVYELSLPPRSGIPTGTVDPNILQAKIDPQNIQRALDGKSERYAIRLPKPEAYLAASHFRSRAGSSYPPDASTERDYITSASLRYNVETLSGFSLAGTPDGGAFSPIALQVETPIITFAIDPSEADDPTDLCSTHSRESFHDLAKLLKVNLFVDFPNDPKKCHDNDPQNDLQNGRPMAMRKSGVDDWINSRQLQAAGVAPSWITSDLPKALTHFTALRVPAQSSRRSLLTAIYYFFFSVHVGNCKSPIIVGN